MRQDFESHLLPVIFYQQIRLVKDGELVQAAGSMGKDGFFNDRKIWSAEPVR